MLTISNLDHFYGSSHTLRDITFDVPTGACTTLLGRNGVGKTTLLKCIMGVEKVRSGSVSLDGTDITKMTSYDRAARGIGFVPQGREIFPRLSVEENLVMGLASKRSGAVRDLPSEIWEMFPVLKDMRNRRGGDLSGGQQQQLAIGRALAMRPRVLILDEPTEGIQPSIIKDIERAIRALVERGDMAILLVEQYYDFARDLANHYVVLNRGVVVRQGKGEDMDRDNVRAHLSV